MTLVVWYMIKSYKLSAGMLTLKTCFDKFTANGSSVRVSFTLFKTKFKLENEKLQRGIRDYYFWKTRGARLSAFYASTSISICFFNSTSFWMRFMLCFMILDSRILSICVISFVCNLRFKFSLVCSTMLLF